VPPTTFVLDSSVEELQPEVINNAKMNELNWVKFIFPPNCTGQQYTASVFDDVTHLEFRSAFAIFDMKII
jgi:hypothetical protein